MGKPDECNLNKQPSPTPRNSLAWSIFGLTPWHEGQADMGAATLMLERVGRCDGPILLDHIERVDMLAKEAKRLSDQAKAPIGAARQSEATA